MLTKKYFEIVHHIMIIIVPIIFIILPLIYIKYIAWIPLALVITWVIFNGCIIDKLHHNKANIDTNLTDNITPLLKLFSKTLAIYINKKYLQNTNRPTYIIFSYFVFLVTIACYRLIFNIDIVK